MATSVLFENQLEIPLKIQSFQDFRSWSRTDDFPQDGRIDFLASRIEVDMSPEDLFTHGTPKSEIAATLRVRAKALKLGHLFVDRTRISNSQAGLSAEPDIVFVTHDTLAGGRIRLVQKATREVGRYIEIEGSPDLVVEIVSDTSESKDTERLPEAYFLAGIRESWLIDARGEELIFRVHRRGKFGFEPVVPSASGFQASAVFDCQFRLLRSRGPDGNWEYDLCIERDGDV